MRYPSVKVDHSDFQTLLRSIQKRLGSYMQSVNVINVNERSHNEWSYPFAEKFPRGSGIRLIPDPKLAFRVQFLMEPVALALKFWDSRKESGVKNSKIVNTSVERKERSVAKGEGIDLIRSRGSCQKCEGSSDKSSYGVGNGDMQIDRHLGSSVLLQ
ncbi:hypothetical protein K0M31_003966 [Melipona bicolor]|uniref:Uncharacterized protein n=1 Tax=Melipona bicolor TaxID=60889 RepID=A0AA40FXX0_9HYME|nr:hypothetical protein K0M31_003966 [Melipona bicolor]